jgi:integrase
MNQNGRRERGTGSLRRLGRVFWLRYYHRGRLVEESSGTSDEAEALRILRKKMKPTNTPLFIDPQARRLTFEQLAELVRADYQRKGNRSVRKLDEQLRHLADHFDGWQALAITSDHVDRYADERLATAKPATVNRELSALRRAYRIAVRKGLVPSMPAITLRSEADNVRQGFLDVGDLDPLLAELRQRDAVAADIGEAAFCTLLRRSNLLGLMWSMFTLDVQLGHIVGGELSLPGTKTKNKRPLALPLSGRFLELVDRRWVARLDSCPYVFHRAGRPVVRFDMAWRKPPRQPDTWACSCMTSDAAAHGRLSERASPKTS